MARKRLYIPDEVKTDIRKHLSEKYIQAKDGYFSANEEEDALTGDLGATLRIKNQKVIVKNVQTEAPGVWTWGIDYHKFRGRGPGATENKLGADGLFELSLKFGNRIDKKSLLFQSKINWENDSNLIKEAVKLSTWREAAFVLNFTADEFEAIDLDSVIATRGVKDENIATTNLDKYLGTDFLDCFVGDVDLKYDAVSRKIIWRSTNGLVVATKFSIPHRISINIKAPDLTYGHDLKYDKEISNEDIHNFRMDASEEEMLSIKGNYTDKELNKARRTKAIIYHSDKFSFGDNLLDDLLKRRMQEINYAYDYLKEKKK